MCEILKVCWDLYDVQPDTENIEILRILKVCWDLYDVQPDTERVAGLSSDNQLLLTIYNIVASSLIPLHMH